MPAELAPTEVDVAFSFLAGDEASALELARILEASASTFVFSERQKELAGTNGVAQFTSLYEVRARLVVVLYRAGYGETKWTKIEESAITSRGVTLGWESLLLISLDGTKPKWLPVSRLWYGIKRFGVRVAADVILARLHDVAGHGRPESLVERARKVSRRIESKAESERWRDSEAAVEAVLEEFASLRTILQEQSAAISEAAAEIRLECFAVESNVIGLRLGRTTTTFGWANSYSNTIRDAYLFVRELSLVERGAPNYFDRLWEPQREVHMGLWLTEGGVRVWIADEEPGVYFTTRELAEWHIRRLLKQVRT